MNDEKIDFTLENRSASVGGLTLSFRTKGRNPKLFPERDLSFVEVTKQSLSPKTIL